MRKILELLKLYTTDTMVTLILQTIKWRTTTIDESKDYDRARENKIKVQIIRLTS